MNKNKPRRKIIRLPEYDYSQPGAYFITVCTHQKEFIFSAVKNGEIKLNTFGEIAWNEWFLTAKIRTNVELFEDEFVIMPNHIHGIIWIMAVGATEPVARLDNKGLNPGSLGAVIGQYKSTTARKINKLRKSPGKSVWQRNYYDRIIRNIKEYNDIRNYIQMNPLRWMEKNKSQDNN